MSPKILASYFLSLSLLATSFNTTAEEYYWHIQPEAWNWHGSQKNHLSPELACRFLHENTDYEMYEYGSATPTSKENQWTCNLFYGNVPDDNLAISIYRYRNSCEGGKSFNKFTEQCEAQGVDNSCPSSLTGNPINFATGYKIQLENDYSVSNSHSALNPLEFSKSYRSADGAWRHGYSSWLSFEENLITLVHHNGNLSYFEKEGASYKGKPPETGKLTRLSNRWSYHASNNQVLEFDSDGRLIALIKSGIALNITYLNTVATVTDGFGNTLTFTEDVKKQPLTVTADNVNISYIYNDYKQLTSMTKNYPNHTENKQYLYQDPNDSRLLTGIIDERGVRYATWTYDEQGRAISGEHAAGAEKVLVSYNSDGSSTVTNALGKQTHYQFELIQNIKRIKSITGFPSTNCPDSNSSFTYDTRGLLTTKTDNNGNITTYLYNDRGLETSRTEASGTSQARTTTTEWHPTLYSLVRINEPDRSIHYTYDTQGRQLSKTIISR